MEISQKSSIKPTLYPLTKKKHIIAPEVNQAIAVIYFKFINRGKSGLHREKCQVTPGRRESMESATENIPPKGKGEMVR